MQCRFLFELVLLLGLSSVAKGAKKTLSLYHAVNGGDFVKRGIVTLEATKEKGIKAEVQNEIQLDSASIDAMVETGLYQLKVVDDKTGQSVLASVPACQVRRANFRDEIILTLSNKASVLSVAYTPLVSPLAAPCGELPAVDNAEFNSVIEYETATPGMTVPLVLPTTKPPPGLKWFPRKSSDPSRPNVDMGDQPDNQSFMRKYWYILLPLFIIGITTGEDPQSQQQPGQQGQPTASAGASASTQAPPAVAAPPGGSGARQRRGKRT
mmetsp:Transcript_16271/g.25312  ORF Transcript_16271/g.25312 Transcript_16271/m.25312 type:complete len:267 (-) Transcript_16271:1193-1993(-)